MPDHRRNCMCAVLSHLCRLNDGSSKMYNMYTQLMEIRKTATMFSLLDKASSTEELIIHGVPEGLLA